MPDILTKAGSSQAAESPLPNKHSHRDRARVSDVVLAMSSLAAKQIPLPKTKAFFKRVLKCMLLKANQLIQYTAQSHSTQLGLQETNHSVTIIYKKLSKQIQLHIHYIKNIMWMLFSSYSHVGRRKGWGSGCLKDWHWEFPANRRTAFPFQRHVVVTRMVLQQYQQQRPFPWKGFQCSRPSHSAHTI